MTDPIDQLGRLATLVDKGPLALFGAVFFAAFFLGLRHHLRARDTWETKTATTNDRHRAELAALNQAGREDAISLRMAVNKLLKYLEREQAKRKRREPDGGDQQQG